MRIYTVTFVNTTNIGAALQEYALQKYLEKQGHEVQVVQYLPKVMAKRQSIMNVFRGVKSLKEFIIKIGVGYLILIRKYKYYRFSRKYINLTRKCKSVVDMKKLAHPDIYIAGSDQIWNNELTKWDDGFFLNFLTEAKKIAYAASAGHDNFSNEFSKVIIEKTKSLDAISVREKELQSLFFKLGRSDVQFVLDPVFLLDEEEYDHMAKMPKYRNYVLIYEAEKNSLCAEIAKKIAKQKNLSVIQINRINNRCNVDHVVPCVSPTEFIGLVKHANMVVSNSFHAIAISIIMKKQFWTVKLSKLSSRIDGLLESIGLQDRIVTNSNVKTEYEIDYKKIYEEKLNERISESKKFLNNYIKKIVNEYEEGKK